MEDAMRSLDQNAARVALAQSIKIVGQMQREEAMVMGGGGEEMEENSYILVNPG